MYIAIQPGDSLFYSPHQHVAHMREQRHNSKIGVFLCYPYYITLFFLQKYLNRHNYTLKNGYHGSSTALK